MPYAAFFLAHSILGDDSVTIDIVVIFHLALSAFAFFWLLRDFGVSRKASFLFSLLWASFPFPVLVSASWVIVSYVAASLPIDFLILRRLIRQPSLVTAFLLAAAKALVFFQGNFQYLAMLCLLEILYFVLSVFVVRKGDRWRETVKKYAWSWIFLFFLTLPLSLSVLNAQQVSNERSGLIGLDQYLFNRLDFPVFSAAQLLDFGYEAIFRADGGMFHVGIPLVLAAILLLVGLAGRKDGRDGSFLFLLALLSFLLSTGFVLILYPLPIFNHFRWPFKYFIFFLFFLALGTAVAYERLKDGNLGKPAFYLVAMAVMLNGFVIRTDYPRSHLGNFRMSDRMRSEEYAKLTDELRDSGYRAMTVGVGDDSEIADPSLPEHLGFAYGTYYRIPHFGGYDPLVSRDNARLALGLNYANDYAGPLDPSLLEYAGRWGVKYLITKPEMTDRIGRTDLLGLKEIRRNGSLSILENSEADPLVHWSDDRKEGIDYRFGINGLVIYPDAGKEGTVEIAIADIPGYRYSVNGGKLSDVPPSDSTVRLPIGRGTESVEIGYVDRPFRVGLAIAGAFWAVFLCLVSMRPGIRGIFGKP